jgi:hypothetical protein
MSEQQALQDAHRAMVEACPREAFAEQNVETCEAIARIIDPEAWRNRDGYLAIMTTESCTRETIDRVAANMVRHSFAKARDIVAINAQVPHGHEAIFEVHVGGANTIVRTRAGVCADPVASLTEAINALVAERIDAANCPAHSEARA